MSENTEILATENEYVVDVDKVTVRFNKASEKIDNLKEYFVKLVKKELMFQEFIALQDVDLKIKKGEAWAIIGTNGSGKSTLLKVISRILKPYKGTVKVNGTIASLIELGAGIDPRLTARENIYLNGCILGHSRKFIEERFDKIVEFSELEEFLDSPVKNFSSGMKSRLGFSVATMIEPDILIVDEVLSVGDVLFRKKCMNKMNEMLKNGTTLLFVSHNMEQVKKLCNKGIWLNKGKVVMQGDIDEV
ncbi:MAG: ABC transporter ATP-binding protein, partial [Oscillospiraceae bacterium]|nr:ABC transporter ATP-binding protein [Oscillospiraceae bacterium]